MDKGYHLLKALGFEGMATQVRSKKDSTTSTDCLNFIIQTAKEKNFWHAEQEICQEILHRMEVETGEQYAN